MNSNFETIILQDAVIKMEPLPPDETTDDGPPVQESKIGEIFHVKKDHFKFVCVHCPAEFSLLIQFVGHVQQHLHEIYVEANDMKLITDLDVTTDTRLELCSAAGPSNGTRIRADKAANKKRRNEIANIAGGSQQQRPEAKKYRCAQCAVECGQKGDMLMHLKAQHPSNDSYYSLPICSASNLGKARKLDLIECCECDKAYSSDIVVKQHWILEHMPSHQPTTGAQEKNAWGLYECSYCRQSFNRLDTLSRHRRRVHCDKRFSCNICGLKVIHKQSVRRHLTTAHPGHSLDLFTDAYIGDKINDEDEAVEEEATANSSRLLVGPDGNTVVFVNDSYECYLCRERFNLPWEMRVHFRRKHVKRKKRPYVRYRLCTCGKCGKQFDDVELLRKHRQWHKHQLNERSTKCDVCEKTFVDQSGLKQHLKTHAATRAFKCEICDLTFKSIGYRNWHMHRHTGRDKRQCEKCGKVCADPQLLKRHMRTHTGERPYKCEDCGKSYRQSGHLAMHRRSHTGEYLHYCKPCNRGFGARREFRNHNFSVHGLENEPKKMVNK